MKDNFSANAGNYVKFRPGYPTALYTFLLSLVPFKNIAWDCGTGNGQIAGELAHHFDKVYATDISEAQLKNAVQADNIFYKVERAEETRFHDRMFNLITVGQAIHWFEFDKFYAEVKRILKPDGILALIGYGLISSDEEVNAVIGRLYYEIAGPYWDRERKYIDENYQTIPFPFKEIQTPEFNNAFEWTLEQMTGYLNTWSAVQHYIRLNNRNPVDMIYNDLKEAWSDRLVRTVNFPILLKVGSA